jgi:tRNA splicing endonuclease
VDFNVYDRGEYPEKPSKFLIFGLPEGSPIKAGTLIELLRRAQANRKVLILATIDRRSEVVYYEISRFH